MGKICERYRSILNERPDPGECPGKCVMQVLHCAADKLAPGGVPGFCDIGVQAPPSAEHSDIACFALPVYRYDREVARIGISNVPDIVLLHADHHRTGCDVPICQDAVIRVPGTAPEPALPSEEQILHGVKKWVPPSHFTGVLHMIDPVPDKRTDARIVRFLYPCGEIAVREIACKVCVKLPVDGREGVVRVIRKVTDRINNVRTLGYGHPGDQLGCTPVLSDPFHVSYDLPVYPRSTVCIGKPPGIPPVHGLYR